jgi:hypothetical protein
MTEGQKYLEFLASMHNGLSLATTFVANPDKIFSQLGMVSVNESNPNVLTFDYEENEESPILFEEDDQRYHYLTLRRLIPTETPEFIGQFKEKSLSEKVKYSLNKELGIFSSDDLVRDIFANKDIAHQVQKIKVPYMLLAKFETYETFRADENETLFRVTRPILVAPDIPRGILEEWEKQNTRYQKERFLFGRKLIKREEYFANFR